MQITNYYCTKDKIRLFKDGQVYKCLKCKDEFMIIDNTTTIIADHIAVVLGVLYIIKIN